MRMCVKLAFLLAAVLALAVLAAASAYAWTYPTTLNTNAATDSGDDRAPQVTTDGGDNWVAVWGSNENLFDPILMDYIGTDYDILVSRSANDGATWTAPTALNTNAVTDSGIDYRPQLTSDTAVPSNWVAVWDSTENLLDPILMDYIGTDRDILVSRSTNDGATWTAPAALNTNAVTDSGDDGYPEVTTDSGDNWVTVWHSTENLFDPILMDYIGTDYDILVSRSNNDGAIWTAPAALNTNAATDSGRDDDPQLTTDGAANWVALWNSDENLFDPILMDYIGTDYDILVSHSTDNGVTWTAPAALNTNATSDSGDDWNPQVTTDGAANWVAVWRSNENVGGTIDTDPDILYATEGPPAPVGGIAEYPDVTAPASGSGPSAGMYTLLGGLAAGALVALTAGAWYARRRWMG